MSKSNKIILAIALVLAVCAAVVQNVILVEPRIDSILDIQAAENGEALVARNQGDRIEVCLISQSGTIKKKITLPRRQGGELISITDMAMNSDSNLYLLKNRADELTGKTIRQELEIYNLGRPFF